jgi:hypothetical protein
MTEILIETTLPETPCDVTVTEVVEVKEVTEEPAKDKEETNEPKDAEGCPPCGA